MLVAVERNGPVRAVPVASDKIAELSPQVKRFFDKDSYLITDEKCVACGACMAICPAVFEADEKRKSSLKEGADLSLPCVDTAIEACPRRAIERK